MGDDTPSIDTEWSPLAPSSAATAIGWKKKTNKRSKSPKQAPSDNNSRKRPYTASVEAAVAVAETDQEQISQSQLFVGPLNKQESVCVDTVVQESCDALPDGMAVQLQGSTAILTFTKHPLHICLIGRAKIKVTSGAIDVLGYRLDKDTDAIEIESPTWTSAITLVSLESDCEVRVDSIRQQGTEQTFRLGDPSQNSVRPTMIPESWKTAMDCVLDDVAAPPSDDTSAEANEAKKGTKIRHARVVVCGAKHVGKSTCIRYAVNRLLSSSSFQAVALLDCDAGQPEMSPPGMLTLTLITKPLLSPPHHHIVMGEESLITTQHVNAYFYGHTTSKADPSLFLRCITKLFQSHTQLVEEQYGGDESNLPLLVNTDGWIKGMGFEILSATLDTVQPNHVIQLLGEVRSKVFDLTGVIKETTTLHEAHSYRNSSVTHESNIEVAPVAAIQSSMYRSLRLCTYFLGAPTIWDRIEFGQTGIADFECEIGQSLASMKPYTVSMDCVHCGTIRGVDNPCDLGSEDVVLDALNGSVVGLCCSGATVATVSEADSEAKPLPCVGLGLIRSIDRFNRRFFILTPISIDTLQSVNMLVGGSIQVPNECRYRGVQAESFPYMSCDGVSVGVGGEFMKSRNTLMRRQSSL